MRHPSLRTRSLALSVLVTASLLGPAPARAPRGPNASDPKLEVRVEPRVELAAVLCRLAGFDEYQTNGIAAYDKAVETHFRRFENHPSVEALRRIRAERSIAYSDTVELALAATPGTWKPRLPIDPWPVWMARNWTSASARAFLEAAARFEKDTGAAAFFEGQRDLYRRVETHLTESLESQLDFDWFASQFGKRAGTRFVVVPGLLHGQNSYGPHLELPGGTLEIYAVIGTPRFGENDPLQYPIAAVMGLLVHELGHSYVNPWVDRNARRLQPGAERLFAAVEAKMRAAAYGSWQIMVYESLVRANTLRYFADHGDAAKFRSNLADDRARGFLWVDDLAEALKVPDGKSPRFERAEPAVFAFVDEWGRDPAARLAAKTEAIAAEEAARRAKGPQITTLVPADGDKSVDPSLSAIEIHFDRPMSRGMSILGSDIPEVTGRPAWDESRRVLRIPVSMKPGTSYRLYLNSENDRGFQSEAGEVLVPRVWSFTTR